MGAGDDCAVIGRPRDRHWQLLKTDAVVEGVHFRPDEDPHRIGWKALSRALSDIAAMGGQPQHALITIAAPPVTDFARLHRLYAGLRKSALRFGVSIVGGETSRSPGPLFINVALTGTVERARCILRSGGRPGDALYVTGRLGGSLAGRHLDFIPRVAEARWLTANFKLHAMMDLSDGLTADLPRLATASRCAFTLEDSALPKTKGCNTAQALSDGEDYELLFTVSSRSAAALEAAWKHRFPRLALTRIGSLTNSQISIAPTAPRTSRQTSNRNSQLPRGHDHFRHR